MCGSIGEPDELLGKIRARRRAAGEPVSGAFDPDKSVIEPVDKVEIPAGIRTSVKLWLSKHSECGGEMVTYVGDYELRIGCTCGDKAGD